MKYWVLMCNDYPEGIILGTEQQAQKHAEDQPKVALPSGIPQYWRVYPFKVLDLRFKGLSEEQKGWHEAAVSYGGVEVHRDDWPTVQELIDRGLCTLSGSRGPNNSFRRLEIVPLEDHT